MTLKKEKDRGTDRGEVKDRITGLEKERKKGNDRVKD